MLKERRTGLEHTMDKKNPRDDGFDHYHSNACGIILLIVTAIVVAPILHELSHMLFLDVNHEPYDYWIRFSVDAGIYGKVTPYGGMDTAGSLVLLGVGIFSNLLFSAVLFYGGWAARVRGMTHESILSTYAAVGFFYNPLMYFFETKGDLVNMLTLLDLGGLSYALPAAGVLLLAAVMLHVHDHAKNVFWGQEDDLAVQFI